MSAAQKRDTRFGHAELMDKVYRRQRHIYDLTRKYYLLGRDRLVRELDAKPGERIVEIGCGTARNLIRVAEAYPDTRLYGLDASSEMLRTAAEALERSRLSGRITLRHALADDLTPALFGLDQEFDHAIFSYSLSMIPDWRSALVTAARAVRPGGRIHVVDFGDLRTLWPAAAQALRAWLKLFHVAPRDELLAILETANSCSDTNLTLLPGRYAFVFKANPGAVTRLAA